MKEIRIILIIIFLAFVGAIIYWNFCTTPPDWTGFGKRIKDSNIEPAKTLWDWLKLLIIPSAIGLLGWSYKEAEKERVRKNEAERSKNEALDSFVKIMTELIINHDLAGSPKHQAKVIAKTRVTMALSQLDGARKGQLLQFLYQSNLIDKQPILPLLGANFNNSILDKIVLGESEIRGAYFKNASIKDANLNEIILNSSNLQNADLSGSTVKNADLSYTNLTNSKLMNMDLRTVNFEGANLTNTNLRKSKITKKQLDLIRIKKGIKYSKDKIS